MVTTKNLNHFATFEPQEDGEVWQSQSRRHCKLTRMIEEVTKVKNRAMHEHTHPGSSTCLRVRVTNHLLAESWRSISGCSGSEAFPWSCRWSNNTRKAASFGENLGLGLLIFQAFLTMNTTVSRWQFWTKISLPSVVISKQWTVIAFLYLHQSLSFLGYDQNRISE